MTIHFRFLSGEEACVSKRKQKFLNYFQRKKVWLLLVCTFLFTAVAHAQNILNKKISINVSQKKIPEALQVISKEGNFYFSYDSRIVNSDTTISLSITNATVQDVLNKIFSGTMDYIESGNYLILRKRVIAEPPASSVNTYFIKGVVKDANTGAGVQNASVYEKTNLSSTLTGDDGSFTLKLKTKSSMPMINVSKANYFDTGMYISLPPKANIVVNLQNKYAALVDSGTITIISPRDTKPIIIPDTTIALTRSTSLTIDTNEMVEHTGLGNFFISTKLKIQSVNLSGFYTTRIYQMSLTPGLSTHGKLSPQVENIISINVLGGYTGGTSAFEVGGLFNIDRRNAQYFQAAGLFNMDGGNLTGVQAAGLHNHVLGNVQGFQAAGISNYDNGNINGMQVAGIYNHARDTASGVQVAGIANYNGEKLSGVQIAGISNIERKNMDGVQIGGIFNYAKKMNGFQLGLINIADSSNGFSLGLINIVQHGYHQLTLSTNEITNTNIDIKTGNKKFYGILHAGYNFSNNNKVFSYGYGFGTITQLNHTLSLQPELKARYLYTGDWSNVNVLSSLSLNFQVRLAKNIALFAAPVFNVYYTDQTAKVDDYKFPVQPAGFPSVNFSDKVNGWLGFSAGIALF
jgi:hypothetical protein